MSILKCRRCIVGLLKWFVRIVEMLVDVYGVLKGCGSVIVDCGNNGSVMNVF